MKILINRPIFDSINLKKILEKKGYEVIVLPIIKIIPIKFDIKKFSNISIYIFTSRNAIRSIDDTIFNKDLPVYVVGEGTAEEAKLKNFKKIIIGKGDVFSLCKQICNDLNPKLENILYLSGKKISFDLLNFLEKYDYNIRRQICYETRELGVFSEKTKNIFIDKEIDAIAFYSKNTAKIFNKLIINSQISDKLYDVKAFCLSKDIASELNHFNRLKIYVSENPNQKSFISLLDKYK
ncbi:uroporphyrinogen-III synthase [Alphaproteobacteria bacterium]|nr:uroporphyrinogen-III synthase [Alphaproteobacteria bacterium]